MRRFTPAILLAATLPLAACFDADITADFSDTDAVRIDAIMTMGADTYQMVSATGEDPCEEGVGTINADGSFTCAMKEQRPLDELLEAMNDPDDEIGFGDGVEVARLDNGNLRVVFDLSDITADMPSREERVQMAAMFGDAFAGHAITMSVVGEEIVETNGTVSEDGTTARFALQLADMFSPTPPAIPETFHVTLVPGN